MSRRLIKTVLALLVTAAALWLSFRSIDLIALKSAFRALRIGWLILAVGGSLFGVYLYALRWAVLLGPKARLGLWPLFRTVTLAQCVNIILPARLGEAVRVWGASRDPRLPVGFVLGTIAAEKAFDVFLYLALWAAVPTVLVAKQGFLGFWVMAGAAAVGAGGIALAIFKPHLVRGAARSLQKLAPASQRERIARWTDHGLEAFVPLRRPGKFFSVIGLTFLVLFNQVLTNALVFLGMGLRLPPAAPILVLLATQAGAVPPSVPGKFGVFEYAVILSLAAFAVPHDTALAAGIVLHIVAYVPKLVLGGIFAIRQRIPGSVLK